MPLVATGYYTITDYSDKRPRFAFIRSATAPATPTGVAPSGWTLDQVPTGTLNVWSSQADFDSSGNLISAWSTPAQIGTQGIQGLRAWKYLGPYAGTNITTLEASIVGMVAGDIYLYVDTATLVKGTGNSKLRQYTTSWADVSSPTSDQVSAAQGDILQRATFLYGGSAQAIGLVAFFALLFAQNIIMGPTGVISSGDGAWSIQGDGTATFTGSRVIGLDWEQIDFGDYTTPTDYLKDQAGVNPYDFGTYIPGASIYIPATVIDGGGWMGAAL